jgi:hypothetical protein
MGIYVSDWSNNVKILDNTIDTIVVNPIYASTNHTNLEIAGNTLHSEVDATKALMWLDYDLTSSNIHIHDNICNNLVNQKWLEHADESTAIYACNNIPSFPLNCSGAVSGMEEPHYKNNFLLNSGDRASTQPGLDLGAGVNHIDVVLSAETQAKLYVAAVACSWGYKVTGITTTWATLAHISAKSETGFTITFGTVTPDANQHVYYDIEGVV